VERTKDDSHAYQEVTDTAGNTTASPVAASKSYTNWFPGLQAKYEIQPKLITRATWSSTLARPGFNQINYPKRRLGLRSDNRRQSGSEARDGE